MRLTVAVVLAAAGAAQAAEVPVTLKDGPGRAKVYDNCQSCHSLDYVQMNSPFLDRKGWEAEVNKMVKVYNAPVAKDDLADIVDYLDHQYGKP